MLIPFGFLSRLVIDYSKRLECLEIHITPRICGQQVAMDTVVRKRTHSVTADGIEAALRAGEESEELSKSIRLFRAILRDREKETERRVQPSRGYFAASSGQQVAGIDRPGYQCHQSSRTVFRHHGRI